MIEPLRPMSTGQLLDHTFALYRQNFLLFVGIATVGPAASVIFQLLAVGANVTTPLGPRNPQAAASLGIGTASVLPSAGQLRPLVSRAADRSRRMAISFGTPTKMRPWFISSLNAGSVKRPSRLVSHFEELSPGSEALESSSRLLSSRELRYYPLLETGPKPLQNPGRTGERV